MMTADERDRMSADEIQAALSASAARRQAVRDRERAEDLTVWHKGFNRAQLREAFDRISHPLNWKEAYSSIVPIRDLALYETAAEFFAGSPVTVLDREPEHFGPGRKCIIHMPGYYACVGA